MAKNDYYTIYDRGDHFWCQKVDPDDRTPVTQTDNPGTMPGYSIFKATSGEKVGLCECWAGSKWCRHKQMLVIFRKLNRVDSRWLFNFDKNKWLPPIQQES